MSNDVAGWRSIMFAVAALASLAVRSADQVSEHDRVWAARPAENARLLQSLDSLDPVRFYRLDGSMKPGKPGLLGDFHHHPVLAAAAPDAATRAAFKVSLRRVLESSDGSQSACFFPRHGVTLSDGKQQYDVVLCFECDGFAVYDGTGRIVYQSGFDASDEAARWDAAFDAAGAAIPRS